MESSSGNTPTSRSSPKVQKFSNVPPVVVQHVSVNAKDCIFCASQHSLRHCPQYSTVNARKAQLEALGHCKRCCVSNHKTSGCKITSFNSCVTCQKTNHHGYLCFKLESQSTDMNANITNLAPTPATSTTTNSTQGRKDAKPKSSDWGGKNPKPVTPNPETPCVSDTVTISTLRTVDTQVLTDVSTQHSSVMSTSSAALPTTPATILSSHRSSPIQTHCFFDQGSQQTFITKTLQDSLGLKPVSKISI